jgi:hypothetical protein
MLNPMRWHLGTDDMERGPGRASHHGPDLTSGESRKNEFVRRILSDEFPSLEGLGVGSPLIVHAFR